MALVSVNEISFDTTIAILPGQPHTSGNNFFRFGASLRASCT
jgi:hypothetical protein